MAPFAEFQQNTKAQAQKPRKGPLPMKLNRFLVGFLFLGGTMGPLFAQDVGEGKDQWSKIEDIRFVADCDKTMQNYLLLFPPKFQVEQPVDLLIALHGHGSDRWQFARDGRPECRAARDFAREKGMIYLCPDYRAKTSWMGPKAEADMTQIIGDLRKRQKISRVFLTGGSMGGSAALTYAALHPALIAGVATMNGTANHLEYDQFQDAIAASFGGPKSRLVGEYKARSAEYWPERLTMPIGFTTGGKDALVPPQSCLRLARVLQGLCRDVLLIHRDQGGHETNLADARAILEFVYQKAKP